MVALSGLASIPYLDKLTVSNPKENVMSSSKRLSRWEFVQVSGVTAGLVTGAIAPAIAAEPAIKRDADSVLAKLLVGNERFVKGATIAPRRTPTLPKSWSSPAYRSSRI